MAIRAMCKYFTLLTISDAVRAALSPLRLGESLRNIRAEFRWEGMESEEVSELPLEEVEVLE